MNKICVRIEATADIVEARRRARELAAKYSFSKTKQTRFATAVSELARNVITYAVPGECCFEILQSNKKFGLVAHVVDNGPGIDNIELALEDGYSSGGGLGLGLPGAKRLVDTFEMKSKPGSTEIKISIIQDNTSPLIMTQKLRPEDAVY